MGIYRSFRTIHRNRGTHKGSEFYSKEAFNKAKTSISIDGSPRWNQDWSRDIAGIF